MCMSAVPPKDAGLLPSHTLSSEAVALNKQKSRFAMHNKRRRRREEMVRNDKAGTHHRGAVTSHGVQDAASTFESKIFSAPLFIPGEISPETAPSRKLFTISTEGSATEEVQNIRSAMEETKKKLSCRERPEISCCKIVDSVIRD